MDPRIEEILTKLLMLCDKLTNTIDSKLYPDAPKLFKIPPFRQNYLGHPIVQVFKNCSSKEDACQKARAKSGGRTPQHHEGHRRGELPHYHLHNHCLALEDGQLVNYHFCYNPRPSWLKSI